MYQEFLRKELSSKKYGIYSRLIEIYKDQAIRLKTASFFRRWLAEELKVEIEKISLSSLDSALQRQKNKKGDRTIIKKEAVNDVVNAISEPKKESFQFIYPSSKDAKSKSLNEK